MSALLCGSMAYDTIMAFHDRFKNHILPDKVHMLNISFLVPELRREYGGCAGNIAYNLNLLGETAMPMATVGEDFGPYAAWMDRCGISRRYIKVVERTYTAQAFITTDQDDNQITAFHPGAMSFSHYNRADEVEGIRIAIVSPDGREGMIEHARQLASANIPFVFDPGQGMPMFDGADLLSFLDLATWATFNDYEAALLRDRTGKSLYQLAERVEGLVVTRGGQGSSLYLRDRCIEIPVAPARTIADPTGCGDAFRAGFLYGLLGGLDLENAARIGAVMGAIKVEHKGTQNHNVTLDEIRDRFREAFGYGF